MKKVKIFFNGSKTYFWSSVFFPRGVRSDVFTLYAFVRKADDFVDCAPQKRKEFLAYRRKYEQGLTKRVDDPIINDFTALKHRLQFPDEWVEGFFDAMQADLHDKRYKTMNELENYIFGSAEVIGLMMNRIMGVSKKYDKQAKALGKAMQLINFIRDVQEDNELARTYIPEEIRHGLPDLKEETARKHPHAFIATIQSALTQYEVWMQEAQPGLAALPRRCRIPVATAAAMYDWTARVIRKNPFVVFRRKVKPSKLRVLLQVFKQSFKNSRQD